MLRIVVAPDSFKGSLSAPEVCTAIARGLVRAIPDVDLRPCPMADGGEGTLETVLAAIGVAGRRRTMSVQGAGDARRDASFGLIEQSARPTAIIEAAQIVGLTDPAGTAAPVELRSTRGVGELVTALLDGGVRRFMIGLGGSSTNDGGSGMLAALGLRLYDSAGRDIPATPAGLAGLARIDGAGLDQRLADSEIIIMSDVDNPLTGPTGATAVFGPQKGVGADRFATIDAVIARFAALAEAAVGRRCAALPGAGAAGGLGFALQLVGGTFSSGAEIVAGLIGLDAALAGADWAITGEGRSDTQTLLSKAPFIVARHAALQGVPITLLSGAVEAAALPALGRHFAGCYGLPDGPATLDDCLRDAAALLANRAEQAARLFLAGRSTRASAAADV